MNDIKSKEPSHRPLQIFCGQGESAYFSDPNSPAAGVGLVTVDARDICRPLIKIKFSSIVSLTKTEFDPAVLLTFSLFRSCDNEAPILLDNWIYEATELEDVNTTIGLTTSFTFLFCDCLNCSRLCDYFVQVSVEELSAVAVSVDNVQIQAIAHQELLSCGQGMDAVFPGNNTAEPIIPIPSSARLGNVTVNTKSLVKPVVEIEFSSIVNLVTPNPSIPKASLNFQLFRVCNEEEPVLINNWVYESFLVEETISDAIRLSTSFSFIFCECLGDTDCCDYLIEVSVGGLQGVETISITDVHIAAIVGESEEFIKSIDCAEADALDTSKLLSCGRGGSGVFTNTSMPPISVGSVISDTRGMCKPRVSIEFSSIVSFLATDTGILDINDGDGAEGRLNFTLFRVCDGGKSVSLNNWIYEVNKIERDFDDMRFIDSFDFNYCDDMACSGCCEYFVEVTVENILTAVILVDNVHITVLIGEGN